MVLGSETVSLISTNEGEGEIPPNRIPSLGFLVRVRGLRFPSALFTDSPDDQRLLNERMNEKKKVDNDCCDNDVCLCATPLNIHVRTRARRMNRVEIEN